MESWSLTLAKDKGGGSPQSVQGCHLQGQALCLNDLYLSKGAPLPFSKCTHKPSTYPVKKHLQTLGSDVPSCLSVLYAFASVCSLMNPGLVAVVATVNCHPDKIGTHPEASAQAHQGGIIF